MAALSKENPLKDAFNPLVVRQLATSIEKQYREFNSEAFIKETCSPFPELGFLERSKHLRDMLYKFLSKDFPTAINILIKSLGKEIDDGGVASMDNFYIMSECDYVSTYGKNHFDESMNALYEMTKRFSAEGDLRTFLEVDYERCMKLLDQWCSDKSEHVRRLVSEGTRCRLPLSGRIKRFQEDPTDVITLLDRLKDDESLYVRRSVANNINDIVKDNPDIAITTLERWQKEGGENVDWMIRHASRSLIKEGNKSVLKLHGYNPEATLEVSEISINRAEYAVGDVVKLTFSVKLVEKVETKLMIDYIVDYQKANGKRSEKVFKMRDIVLASGEIKKIEKKHTLRNTAGRKHYTGEHAIALQINGVRYPKVYFSIKDNNE